MGAGTLKVSDTMLRDNGSSAISLDSGPRAVISSTQMLDNGSGVVASGSSYSTVTTATLSDCVISGGGDGVSAYTFAAALARISVARSTIERTGFAIETFADDIGVAQVNVGSSQIVNNTYAWIRGGTGARIFSLGDNQMSGNANPIGGVATPLAGQ
jgi:hypothetical protein